MNSNNSDITISKIHHHVPSLQTTGLMLPLVVGDNIMIIPHSPVVSLLGML